MTANTIVEETQAQAYAEENVGNIVLLEHVNVEVSDQSVATLFYLVGMGFTRDPHMMVGLENMWVNLGEQQFHLPTRPQAQVLRGHVGIVVPSLDALADRLEAVAPKLGGTRFSWSREGDHIDAVSPWGNLLRCYEPSEALGGISLGIPYVEFTVPVGTADGIRRFYEQALLAPASVVDQGGRRAVVQVGNYQELVFRESDVVPAYDNHHIAIYIANFSSPHAFLAERGLVTEEPRNHQFRFKDIVDPDSGELLFTIEHEVRGMRHVQYRRPLVNRMAGQYLEPRRVNGQTVLGTVM